MLALIGEGLTNRQIGERMFLAEKTVKNYVSHLLAKLGHAAAYPGGDPRHRAAPHRRPRTVSRRISAIRDLRPRPPVGVRHSVGP